MTCVSGCADPRMLRQAPANGRRCLSSPGATAVDDNLAITGIGMDRTLVSAGRPAGVRVTRGKFRPAGGP